MRVLTRTTASMEKYEGQALSPPQPSCDPAAREMPSFQSFSLRPRQLRLNLHWKFAYLCGSQRNKFPVG